MTDTDDALDLVARAANELLPHLGERLARHGLGELEVRDGNLRLRVRGTPAERPVTTAEAAAAPSAEAPEASRAQAEASSEAGSDGPAVVGVPSPAVGFFVYADGLGPGLEVSSGDPIGHVEMLGVRHEVRVPRGGTVRSLVAESGEAVEYGQVVVELEASDAR